MPTGEEQVILEAQESPRGMRSCVRGGFLPRSRAKITRVGVDRKGVLG